MKTVTSKDGTHIAFDKFGEGPAVILVGGALAVRLVPTDTDLPKLLASDFTVINYDRRGRGDSGNTLPYAVEREIEDIEALIDAVGGSAYLYGLSSGAILALEAAANLSTKVEKLALYEPPFIIDDSRPPLPADYVDHLSNLVVAGRRGDAVEYFMTAALLIPTEFVDQMRTASMDDVFDSDAKPPDWAAMEAVAHTLPYDGEIVKDFASGKPLPPERWASATMPTAVIVGEYSEPFFHDGAKSLVSLLPNGQYIELEGQHHAVSPAALAPVLKAFFAG